MRDFPEGVRLEEVCCPACGSAKAARRLEAGDTLHHLPGTFTVVACTSCGLQRTNPRPTPDTMGRYYPADYQPYVSPGVDDAAPPPRRRSAWRSMLLAEDRQLPAIAPGRMLEIGCAAGGYLVQMQRLGWRVEGLEFSAAVADRARARGLRVQAGTVEQADLSPQSYDVVTAWMVLEHLHEPVAALRKLRMATVPDGWLVASIPDAGALARRAFGAYSFDLQLPTHLFHYDRHTIRRVLAAAGWELVRIRWQRNCITLLKSLEMWAEHTGHPRVWRWAHWARTAHGAARLRLALGTLLGLVRQSGRMEIWARPAATTRDAA